MTIPASQIDTVYEWRSAHFSKQHLLSMDRTYHLVLYTVGDSSNCYQTFPIKQGLYKGLGGRCFLDGRFQYKSGHTWNHQDPSIALNLQFFFTLGATLMPVEKMNSRDPTGCSSLAQNYPIPFNPENEISFTVSSTAMTVLEVFDVLGQRIARLFEGTVEGGKQYHVHFNSTPFASGTYFCVPQNDILHTSKKTILMK